MRQRLLLALLLAVCAPAWAETFYVRPVGGSYGAEDGTSYAAAFKGFADIAWATSDTAGSVDADDTLYVCGAHGDTKLSLTTAQGEGSSGQPITVDCRCGPQSDPATWTLTGGQTQGISLGAGVDYVTLIGCTVNGPTNGSGDPEASIATLDGVGIIMTDVTVSGNTVATGIRVRKCQTCTFTRPVSYNNLNHGLYIVGDAGRNATDITVTAPLTYGNGVVGVKVTGSTTAADVQRVTISDPVSYGNGDGLYVVKSTTVTIYGTTNGGCKSYSNLDNYGGGANGSGSGEGYGIGVQNTVGMTIYNCEIHDNYSDGIEVYGDESIASTSASIKQNLIYGHANYLIDDTGSNGIECRTGYSDCTITANILLNNTKGLRLGNDSSALSKATNNTIMGGTYSIRMVDSNEAGTNATTGWVIDNNILSGASTELLHTDVTASNSNTFANNDFVGSGTVATYNNTTYTASSISAVDATRINNVSPQFAGGCGVTSWSTDCKLSGASALRRAGACFLTGSCAYPDYRGRLGWTPPDVGAYQSTSGDEATARTAASARTAATSRTAATTRTAR